MENSEALYIATLEDIKNRIDRNNKYDVIKASGLLRLLLLDGMPLIHQINRKYRVTIRFSIVDYSSFPILEFSDEPQAPPVIFWQNVDASQVNTELEWTELNASEIEDIEAHLLQLFEQDAARRLPISFKAWLHEDTNTLEIISTPANYYAVLKRQGKEVKTKQVDLQSFLKVNSLIVRDSAYSIRDIIKYCAHYKGGVHLVEPTDEIYREMLDLDELIEIGGLDFSLAALKGICNIVLKGIEPLTECVIKNTA